MSILLYNCRRYNLKNQLFLSKRKHHIRVNGTYSESKPVTSVFPKSVVRPVLFVIYINDIPDKLSPESYIFADDTNIFRQTEATQYKEQLCNMTLNNKNTGPTFSYFASIRTNVK